MRRLLILAVVTTIAIPTAGCNCCNMFRRKEACGYVAPPPPVQAGCPTEGQQYLAPVGGAPVGEIYGPAPQ